jgi:hypothetical protein
MVGHHKQVIIDRIVGKMLKGEDTYEQDQVEVVRKALCKFTWEELGALEYAITRPLREKEDQSGGISLDDFVAG